MQGVYAGTERRRFRRAKADFTMIYQVNRPIALRMEIGWNKDLHALMLDLGEGGLALSTGYDIPAGAMLSTRFTLINLLLDSGKRKIRARAEVRYNILQDNKERRLGLCFKEIDEEDKKAIADFVLAYQAEKNKSLSANINPA